MNNTVLPRMTRFIRSSKRTCPICGNTHRFHCSLTEDHGLALCKYVPSDRQASDGRFIHCLENQDRKFSKSSTGFATAKLASSDHLHAVYEEMLERLTLKGDHGRRLMSERGLSDTTIATNLYSTTPNAQEAKKLLREFAQIGIEPKGVPGFFFKYEWCLNLQHGGLYVPCRDERRRIVGCQIRRDTDLEPKYVWLSSRGMPQGTTSGAPIHFANPDLVARTRRAIITEGLLKADICADLLGCCVIGLPGASSVPANTGATLRQKLPHLAEVALAFDADWRTKSEVQSGVIRLYRSLRNAGFKHIHIWTWDPSEGKGLDDYLLARKHVGGQS